MFAAVVESSESRGSAVLVGGEGAVERGGRKDPRSGGIVAVGAVVFAGRMTVRKGRRIRRVRIVYKTVRAVTRLG